MSYREQPAPGGLTRWVECIWSLETCEAIEAYPVRPDGCIDILYSGGRVEVVGAMTVERRFDIEPHSRRVGLRFRPGMAAPFLRMPVTELTDRVVPLEELWGSRVLDLAMRIADVPSIADACHVLTGAVSPPPTASSTVQRALEMLASSHGNIDLEWIARQAGMSDRQFRRRCLEESGLAPKQLCRVLRFRHAFALGQRGLPWGLVAAEAGYFDQAHMIRDFREFTGATPASVFSNTGGRVSG